MKLELKRRGAQLCVDRQISKTLILAWYRNAGPRITGMYK